MMGLLRGVLAEACAMNNVLLLPGPEVPEPDLPQASAPTASQTAPPAPAVPVETVELDGKDEPPRPESLAAIPEAKGLQK